MCIAIDNLVPVSTSMLVVVVFGGRLLGRSRRQYFKDLHRQDMASFDGLSAKGIDTRVY